jgi:L-lactate dehydrogenase (cytochrome)
MRVITCVEDLRLLARRRVPRMFYDYADSGSWTESTYRANEADLAAICFRQRVAVNIENRSVRSTMIGDDVAMPVALAPTGLCGMQHADGKILAARAAEAFEVPMLIDDEHVAGQRHKDLRNGLSVSPRLTIAKAMKPKWCLGMLRTRRRTFGNLVSQIDTGADAIVVSNHGGRQLDGAPSSIRV